MPEPTKRYTREEIEDYLSNLAEAKGDTAVAVIVISQLSADLDRLRAPPAAADLVKRLRDTAGAHERIGDSRNPTAILLREAATALERAGAGWRSMESAPKDRFIFLHCREDGSRWLAKWQGGMWYGVDELGLTRTSETHTPTSWTELPAPPEETPS